MNPERPGFFAVNRRVNPEWLLAYKPVYPAPRDGFQRTAKLRVTLH